MCFGLPPLRSLDGPYIFRSPDIFFCPDIFSDIFFRLTNVDWQRLITAERDGYFSICPSPRPNPGENEVYAREQPLQTAFGSPAFVIPFRVFSV